MTERKIIDVLSEALPEGCRKGTGSRNADGRFTCWRTMLFWMTWPSSSVFLFGKPDPWHYPSFFRWLGVWARIAEPGDHHTYSGGCREILAACPWLLGLRDASSLEEMELKLVISGGLA